MSLNLEEQYDKIYRYCYFKVKNREKAEDLTQETFLRYLGSETYRDTGRALHFLYTIAGNLCVDEFRRKTAQELPEPETEEALTVSDQTDRLVEGIVLKDALDRLAEEDRELLLLRYGSEVPVGVICRILGISRFALYRKTNRILKQLREELEV